MSRVGRLPVKFTNKVQISITPQNEVVVKGAKQSLSVKMRPEVNAAVEGDEIVLTRKEETAEARALHGLYRALVHNAVSGLTTPFSKTLELNGVGYRAAVSGKKLELTLGYSHPIFYEIPSGIEVKVDKQTVVQVSGADKQLVGSVAAKIRSFRPPEPYLGKGIKYTNEHIRRKAGKSAGGK